MNRNRTAKPFTTNPFTTDSNPFTATTSNPHTAAVAPASGRSAGRGTKTARTALAAVALAGSLGAAAIGFAGPASSSARSDRGSSYEVPTGSAASTGGGSRAIGSGTDATSSAPTLGRGSDGVVEKQLHRPGEAVEGTDSGSWSSMADLMEFVVQDAANVWNWYYDQWGVGIDSSVSYVFSLPGTAVPSACGDSVTDDSSPFYCPADDTIYMSQMSAVGYWENAGGDFGVAAALAHEYGHNVQTELNIDRPALPPRNFELQADCLSGAFTHVAYYQGVLDANDINEGMLSRYSVGDADDPSHHGTPEERAAAFRFGYDAPDPLSCDQVLAW